MKTFENSILDQKVYFFFIVHPFAIIFIKNTIQLACVMSYCPQSPIARIKLNTLIK